MPLSDSPPFRAEHIGSLLRPQRLLALQGRSDATPDQRRDAENEAIAEAVAMQARLGLKLATDGEFRRKSYHTYFYRQLGDITLEAPAAHEGTSGVASQPQATIRSKLRWTKPVHVDEFQLIRSLTQAIPKITIPGPCALHFRAATRQ